MGETGGLWKESRPLPKGSAKIEQIGDTIQFVLDDDAFDNSEKGLNEAFFYYFGTYSGTTDGVKYKIKNLENGGWKFDYVLVMDYKPAGKDWLENGKHLGGYRLISHSAQEYWIDGNSGVDTWDLTADLSDVADISKDDFRKVTIKDTSYASLGEDTEKTYVHNANGHRLIDVESAGVKFGKPYDRRATYNLDDKKYNPCNYALESIANTLTECSSLLDNFESSESCPIPYLQASTEKLKCQTALQKALGKVYATSVEMLDGTGTSCPVVDSEQNDAIQEAKEAKEAAEKIISDTQCTNKS